MKKVTLRIGTEFNKDGNQLELKPETVNGFTTTLKELAVLTGGYTMRDVRGGYVYKDGELVQEATIEIETCCKKSQVKEIMRLSEVLKVLMDQESVMIMVEDVQEVIFV